jgi:hypothetical protein
MKSFEKIIKGQKKKTKLEIEDFLSFDEAN